MPPNEFGYTLPTTNGVTRRQSSVYGMPKPKLSTDSDASSTANYPHLRVNRRAYNAANFNDDYDPVNRDKTWRQRLDRLAPDCSPKAWFGRLAAVFPILYWLPKYDIVHNLLSDIIVGITVAIFAVPQGMGYALTAHIPPVYGLYSSFFPPLAYIFIGGGQHVSVGTYAIVSGLMTGDIVVAVLAEIKQNATTGWSTIGPVQSIDISMIVAIVIGIYMAAFGVLRLGFISNFLPAELISSFIAAAGIVTFTSQVHYLLGITVTNFTGALAFPRTWIQIFSLLPKTNIATLIVTIISIVVLVFVKYVVDVQLRKLGFRFPLPVDLVLLIVATVISEKVNLTAKYKVAIVGNIPRGFPAPVVPNFKLFPYVWSQCISVAVVAYVTTLAVGRIYGAKHGYKVDDNQELVALGVTNIWSSFFKCLPAAASLPRSALMETAGGKSQVSFIVNCICTAVVILWLGALLEKLPTAVLGSCISVAVYSLMAKVSEFKSFWDVSKLDGTLWMITFLSVLILNVDYGIYIGFGCSLLILIYKSQRPKTYILGAVDESDIYVPINKYGRAKEIPGFKIYQFCGALNFANVEYFKGELQTKTGVDVDRVKVKQKKIAALNEPKQSCWQSLFGRSGLRHSDTPQPKIVSYDFKLPKHIIIDCSMLSFIDTSGVNALKSSVKRFESIGVQAVLTGCPVHVETMLEVVGLFAELPASGYVFKSIHDAVVCCRAVKPKVDQFECHV